MTHPEPNPPTPTPSDRETLMDRLSDNGIIEEWVDLTHPKHHIERRIEIFEETLGRFADAILAAGFVRPCPWREDDRVQIERQELAHYVLNLIRERVDIEGDPIVAELTGRGVYDRLNALCDRAAACGAGSEDTARLDWLAENGNDWTLRGMMEHQAGVWRRMWFVDHDGGAPKGHAVHTDGKIALREALDAARHPAPQEERP
jgi:hypothetical protein